MYDHASQLTFLVDTERSQAVQDTRADVLPSICYDADHDLVGVSTFISSVSRSGRQSTLTYLFPTPRTPSPGILSALEMTDIPHDSVKGPEEQDLILVVHGDDDHELGLPSIVTLTEGKVFGDKVVGCRGDCRVSAGREIRPGAHGELQSILRISSNRGNSYLVNNTSSPSSPIRPLVAAGKNPSNLVGIFRSITKFPSVNSTTFFAFFCKCRLTTRPIGAGPK